MKINGYTLVLAFRSSPDDEWGSDFDVDIPEGATEVAIVGRVWTEAPYGAEQGPILATLKVPDDMPVPSGS